MYGASRVDLWLCVSLYGAQVEELTSARDGLAAELAALKDASGAADERAALAESEITTIRAAAADAEQRLAALAADLEAARAEAQDAQERLTASRMELTAVRSSWTGAEERAVKAEKSLAELKAGMGDAEDRVASTAAELTAVRSSWTSAEERAAKVRDLHTHTQAMPFDCRGEDNVAAVLPNMSRVFPAYVCMCVCVLCRPSLSSLLCVRLPPLLRRSWHSWRVSWLRRSILRWSPHRTWTVPTARMLLR